jgi:hypothetical protein
MSSIRSRDIQVVVESLPDPNSIPSGTIQFLIFPGDTELKFHVEEVCVNTGRGKILIYKYYSRPMYRESGRKRWRRVRS